MVRVLAHVQIISVNWPIVGREEKRSFAQSERSEVASGHHQIVYRSFGQVACSLRLLRTSGLLTLPTQRTLRCYTNFTASEAGFNKEFLACVCQDIKLKGLGEIERNIMLAFNEMKVFQGLVYSHQTGHIIGFTSLSSVNDEMAAFARKCEGEDPQMASHALVLMASGICRSFCRAVAYFATGGATTDQLYHVIMEGTEYLETCGFSVRGLRWSGIKQGPIQAADYIQS